MKHTEEALCSETGQEKTSAQDRTLPSYHTPQLHRLGQLTDLTQGAPAGAIPDGPSGGSTDDFIVW